VIDQISRLIGTWVLILPHLWWGLDYLMLGIHHTLVWNRVFQNGWRWWLKIILWGLLRGRQHWRMLRVHGFFHLFEVENLGAMVSIISILTTYSSREVISEVIGLLLSWFIVINVSPLGVLVSLILVAPNGTILLGVISSWSQFVIVSIFPFLLGIIWMMGHIFHIQLFKSLKLLNGRRLNKINVVMWLSSWRSNRLGWTMKWKILIVLWRRSIWRVGS
jgi:hypothetical protein